MKGFRERLQEDVVLGAEGYLFELERRGYLKAGPFVPEVVLDFPEAVRELHREMLRAGAEVMVAFTYYGHRDKLRAIGREADLEPLNRHALRLARDVGSADDAASTGADQGRGRRPRCCTAGSLPNDARAAALPGAEGRRRDARVPA